MLANTTNVLWLNLSKVKETLRILTGRTGYKPLCGRLLAMPKGRDKTSMWDKLGMIDDWFLSSKK